jgi:nitrous oxide reductase accessory protein NosL
MAGRGATLRLALFAALGLLLAGCFGESDSGPVKIHWDRDACHVCRMLISDRRFAAQVRGGPGHEAYKFDDLGELILWLDQQPWKDEEKTEIWVRDVDSGSKWLDARKARYVGGLHSPMDYGFGAVEDNRPGSLSFGEMVRQVRKRGSTYHCLPQDGETAPPGDATTGK